MTTSTPAAPCPRPRRRPGGGATAAAAGGAGVRAATLAAALLVPWLAGTACSAPGDGTPLVLAAASTVDALDAALSDYRQETGVDVRVSYGPTSTLARQIEAGAPADLFLSASVAWADAVEATGRAAERRVLARNRLVVVVPADGAPGTPAAGAGGGGAAAPTTAAGLSRLVTDPLFQHIGIADPEAVPAGVYARQALVAAGLWEAVEPRLVPTVDVRAALALAARREVEAAFVYGTDAASSADVRPLMDVDPSLHDPIEYPVLLMEGAGPGGRRLHDFLLSDRGLRHFTVRGFLAPDGGAVAGDPGAGPRRR